jgi:cytochrome c551/c552
MKDCAGEPKVASFLPDFARNAHGNLAEQNRMVGAAARRRHHPARGHAAGAAVTAPKAGPAGAGAPTAVLPSTPAPPAMADNKIVGPGFREIARKYAGRADARPTWPARSSPVGRGVWGAIPMPPQTLPTPTPKAIAPVAGAGAKK